MKKVLLIAVIVSLFANVAVSQTRKEKKQIKEDKAEKEYLATKSLIDSKTYVFNPDWLTTNGGRRMSIVGSANFVEIKNDSVKGSLQFFGYVNSGSFNRGGGIDFNDIANNYKVVYDDSKQKIRVTFTVKNKSEVFDFAFSIHKNGNSYVDVNSSIRSYISYNGDVSKPKQKK